jgi:hypothetical protein
LVRDPGASGPEHRTAFPLREALEKLRGNHPNTTIVYADLFGPIIEMKESPGKFGKHLLFILQCWTKMWFCVVILQGLKLCTV